jgi:MFS family permease
VEPFADFLKRYGKHALLILALIGVYRISDVVMGIMANPFYVDMGYTKDEVAAVTKVYGVVMTLVGAFIGGALSLRLGVMRVLMLGAVLSAASNLLFAWLAGHGHDVTALIAVISADNLSAGVASAAFIAYLSSLTNVTYSATQYALFSSMMLLAPKWLAGFSGAFVTPTTTPPSSPPPPCWVCRCWCWCGWPRGCSPPPWRSLNRPTLPTPSEAPPFAPCPARFWARRLPAASGAATCSAPAARPETAAAVTPSQHQAARLHAAPPRPPPFRPSGHRPGPPPRTRPRSGVGPAGFQFRPGRCFRHPR